jgi:hypothetical protein
MISAHTKAALAAAKRRGVKLGGDRGARLTAKARAAGRATLQERARSRAVDLAPTIKELQAAGCESLRAILRRAWRSAAFLRHAAASGLLSRCPDCWRRPALSAEAPPPRETQPAAALTAHPARRSASLTAHYGDDGCPPVVAAR